MWEDLKYNWVDWLQVGRESLSPLKYDLQRGNGWIIGLDSEKLM